MEIQQTSPKVPTLVIIIAWLLLLGGILTLAMSISTIWLFGALGILKVINGLAMIVAAVGIRYMRKWGLYILAFFTIISILFLLIIDAKSLLSFDIIFDFIVLVYLAIAYKEFYSTTMEEKEKAKKLMVIFRTVLLIVILLGMVIFAYGFYGSRQGQDSAAAKNRDAQRKADLRKITRALEIYYADNGQYPMSNSYELMVNALFDSGYLDKKPQDPLFPQRKYRYGVSRKEIEEGLYYRLDTELEIKNDKSMREDRGLYNNRYEVGNALGDRVDKVLSTYY